MKGMHSMMKKKLAATALIVGLSITGLAACSSESVGGAEDEPAAPATDYSSIIPEGDIVEGSKAIVEASLTASEGFTPPTEGAPAQSGLRIAYVPADLTDGGPNGVGVGLNEAADVLGWTIEEYDGKGQVQGHTDAINQAIASAPDAIVLGSVDAIEQATTIKAANDAGIPVFGWHSNAAPGPGEGLVTNISTDPLDVAQLAAAYAVADSDGTAGVAIMTDSQYSVAIAKSDAMAAYIKACEDCKVLALEDSPLSETAQRMPGIISNFLQEYGDDFTYLMGINGNYFTGAAPALESAGIDGEGSPKGIAAGNGDAAELQRIRTGQYQAATVAEPLYLQAWQLADAINSTVAGVPVADWVAKPGLIDSSNVPTSGDVFDPASGYRDIYLEIWGK